MRRHRRTVRVVLERTRSRGQATRPALNSDLIGLRLRNQRLTRPGFRAPADVVSWLGAVQSQDYSGATWAIGLRTRAITANAVGQAFDDGLILRTHVMRPTWHFVAPADIRWLLALTGPRVKAVCAHYCRRSGLDDRMLSRSRKTIESALQGGNHLTRPEIGWALRQAGIDVSGTHLAFVMMRAELDAVVCSGARRGKQVTYALFEERVPRVRAVTRDEALAELTKRYFTSHGPATVHDYAWWSGLTVQEAKTGIDLVRTTLTQDVRDGLTCWFVPSGVGARTPSPSVRLLPNYDEYVIAYKDRGAMRDESMERMAMRVEFAHLVVIDGKIRGTWKRSLATRTARIEVRLFRPLNEDEQGALVAEAARYASFVDQPVKLSIA